jgi:hypothetical protein
MKPLLSRFVGRVTGDSPPGAVLVLLAGVVLQAACTSTATYSPRTEKFGPCQPRPCLVVEVGIPPRLPEGTATQVEEAISTVVAKMLRSGPTLNTPDENDVDMVSETIESFKQELPSGEISYAEWMYRSGAEILFSTEDIVTISVTKEGYLGGAHGFTSRQLLVFSLLDGSRLHLSDFISEQSHSVLSSVAEVELRRVRNIPVATSLSQAGLDVVAGSPLPIPDNFGVVKEGLLFRWNEYEIAPYALGHTEIIIPREACDALVRTDAHLAKKVFPSRPEDSASATSDPVHTDNERASARQMEAPAPLPSALEE